MTFQRLAILDRVDITDAAQTSLQKCSAAPVPFPFDDPVSDADLRGRASGADALIVSWRSVLDQRFLEDQEGLRYVGLCASPYGQRSECNIDLSAADKLGVVVSALGQYGDEATAEWVIASMLNAAHHIGPLHWEPRRRELYGKRLAIIGLGAVGWDVAYRAKALGMDVVYTARGHKPGAAAVGLRHVSMEEALSGADIVSVHVAKGVEVMGESEFDLLRPGALLINTSIGTVLNPSAFEKWLAAGKGCTIGDVTVDPKLSSVMQRFDNAFLSEQPAANTVEMQERKSSQLVENVEAFLNGTPIRVV